MFVGNCSGPDGRCQHGEWSIKQYVRQNRWPYYTSMALMLVCLISMACCESVRRKTPTNFIFLTVFTACEWVMVGFGSAGALIFSLYIIYDTQLMMGGKHKYSLSPEEYIFAALNIYLDVINLFMYILMIVGGLSDD